MELTSTLWESRNKVIGNGIYLHEIFDFFFIRNATDDRIVGSTSSRTVKLVYLRIPWTWVRIKPTKSKYL